MIIYHEQLIPKLCDKHLWKLWADGHFLYHVITNVVYPYNKEEIKEALLEFDGCPLEIAFRLHEVREELNRRGHPLKQTISPFDVSDAPFIQYLKEKKRYTARLTIDEQRRILGKQKCKCSV